MVQTECGERVSLYWNRQRVSKDPNEVGCKRCKTIMRGKLKARL